MAKFRRKAPIFEAEQLDILVEPYPSGVEMIYLDGQPTKMRGSRVKFILKTTASWDEIYHGEWVVTDEEGKTTIVKDEDFRSLYEPA